MLALRGGGSGGGAGGEEVRRAGIDGAGVYWSREEGRSSYDRADRWAMHRIRNPRCLSSLLRKVSLKSLNNLNLARQKL